MPVWKRTVKALRQPDFLPSYDSEPVTQEYARKSGDGYASDAASAVDIAKAL